MATTLTSNHFPASWINTAVQHVNTGWSADFDPPKKSPVMTDVTVDPLAVSCALYRLYPRDHAKRYTGLTKVDNLDLVTDQDIELAQLIHDHYSKQVMMQQLKKDSTVPNSGFTISLAEFLRRETGRFDLNHEPIVYKLPEFYDTDQQFAQLREKHFDNDNGREYRDLSGKKVRTLVPLTRITRNTRSTKENEYWFKDQELGIPVMLPVKLDNNLDEIWYQLFKRETVIRVEANFVGGRRGGFNYLHAYDTKWRVAPV
jgi:hypothetical protein